MTHGLLNTLWFASGVLVACSGTEYRLGGSKNTDYGFTGGTNGVMNTLTGSGGTDAADPPIANFPAGYGDPSTDHAFMAGTWRGYIENGKDLLLEFDSLSADAVAGKIVFGDPATPVPDYSEPHSDASIGGGLIDGYPYTLVSATLQGTRLRFSVNSNEMWNGWCSQQTSVPRPTGPGVGGSPGLGAYHCDLTMGQDLVSSDGNTCVTKTKRKLDCAAISVCSYMCDCSSTACGAIGGVTNFDVVVGDNRLDGSTADGKNVHFTKI